MKHFYLLIIGVLLAYLPLNAQISEGGDPLSKKTSLSFDDIERVQLGTFNLEQVMAEDDEDEKAGNYPKIGRVRPLDINLNGVDSWTDVKGGKLWRIALKSRDAMGLSVQFEDFNLPDGGKLFIYSPDFKHVIGAFTAFNNHESGIFSTSLIPGDEVIVEYFEPSSASGLGQFKIAGLVHAYRMVPGAETAQRDFGDSDPCQVNVNCSEGNNWQDEKRGVVRIFIIEGQFAGWCSGSVVNNTAEDCTPYVLTALHCGINASTNNMNQWVFHFNYESSGCANGSSGQVPNNSMTGCARIADSGDGGGNSGSDYMLVELNNAIPGGYNPHYNGWRRNNVSSPSGVSIHHPSGDIKKISTYTNNLQTTSWGSGSGSHWLVFWSGTANGHGVSEGGSSGSPIFDNQGLIVGTLTGGSSYCNSVVPGGQTQPDLYGKMSYHWSSNPGDNLSQYLDPGNTGAISLDGSDEPCNGQGGGDDCEAGTVSVSTNQDVCPDETGIFNATGVVVPQGGGYAVQFMPDGGTGGNEVGFSITGVNPLPFEFDNDINGILSANELPPLSGTWVLTGFAYTDPEDAGGSFCSIADVDVTVNFLTANDPACTGGGDDCIADIPYPEDDPCVIVVITADDFCCDTEWDGICEDAYIACSSSGECEAGTVSVSTNQDVCPDETGIFNATGVVVPEGGGYAVQFMPDGGTGGNEVGFSITGVNPLPFEFDNDINGILSANELPPLSGTWVLTGFAYTDPEDAGGSFCSIADVDVTVNFLAADDPACTGGSDDNDDCANATLIAPGIHPFSTVGATTDGPDQPGSDCDAFNQSNVNNDVWFEYTASCDGLASLSTCGTADFDTRIAVYPGGQCPPTAGSLIICNDDFGDCADFTSYLEWQVTEGETYLLRIGGYSAEDFGTGTIELIEDCGTSGGDCAADIPYPEDDPCVIIVIAADDFCCDTEWDGICEDAYIACSSSGECEAGTVSVSTNQDVCPDETGIFNATGVVVPEGGGYAVQFMPDGGTGGNEVGFSITGVNPLPFEFDNDINGILSANELPPLSGTWVLTGFAYTDPEDAGGSFCSIADVDVTVNFLAADDPACAGGSDDNDDCADATLIAPGIHPFSTVDATTDGPDQPGSDCDAFNQSNVNNDVWFEYTASCDGLASLSTCGTADFDTRIAVYPGGQCPPTAGSLIICNDDFGDCADFTSYLEWQVTEGETYLLRIGGYSAEDFGTGTIELIEDCDGEPSDWCDDWVDPTPTTGYINFNTIFEGAPTPDINGDCAFNEITDFEVWMSEAYAMDNIQEGVTYTFSHCNGPGAGTWVPEYTIIAPSGTVDAYGAGDGDGCSISWIASETGTYLIVINEAGNCGVAAQIDNGFPAITCSDDVTSVAEPENTDAFFIFPNPNNGQFVLEMKGNGGLAHVDILEVSGKVVQSAQMNFSQGTQYQVDLGAHASGMYFVRITMNNQITVHKVTVH